jgi:hypothetical protein
MAAAGALRNGAWLAAGLALGAGVWLGLRTAAERAPWSETAAAAGSVRPAGVGGETPRAWNPPGEGFLVWESNRTGQWRIWTQRLDGSGLRQLSPEEGERIHCCPHISPDGRWIAWLSLEPGPDRYPEGRPETGILRLLRPDGSGQRTLAPRARTYGEHRAAVWHGSDRLAFIDGEGRSARLSLGSGRTEVLTTRPHPLSGWLIDPTLTHATDGTPTFSLYDSGTRSVTELQAFGGCQPYFTQDGGWGYWIAGAGGPLYRIDFETRETSVVLRKNDPRAGAWGYIYFPMLSPDRRLLAFGASDGGHDHWRADYDIHVAEVHPETLDLVGSPVRVAPHPATDRFPDVWLDPRSARPVPPPPSPVGETHRAGDGTGGWPVDRDRLLFLWETADSPNRVFDSLRGVERSFPVERHGLARLDHHHRMVLGGGTFTASWEASEAIVAGVRETNELTLEATLVPAALRQNAPILALSGGARDRSNLVLAQEGRELVLRLALARRGVARETLRLGPLQPGRGTHLLVSYRPGRLIALRDSRIVLDAGAVQGDFFRWRPRPLVFGGEARSPVTWSGLLEGVAFYGRFLEEDEARENARRALEKAATRPRVPTLRIRGELLARSHTPTLREISPYREALAVYEYRVERVLAGDFDGEVVRVAHWVILDGETLPVSRSAEGELVELTLEPFAANPQLESVFLSDDLPAGEGGLFYDAGEIPGGGAA